MRNWISDYNNIRHTEDKRLRLKVKQHDNDFGKKSQPYRTLDEMFGARQLLFGELKKTQPVGTRYVVSANPHTHKQALRVQAATAKRWRPAVTYTQHDDCTVHAPDMIRTDGFRNFRGQSHSPKVEKYRDTYLQVDDNKVDGEEMFRIKDTLFEKEVKSIRNRRKPVGMAEESEVIPFPKSYAELEQVRKEQAESIKQWEVTVPSKRDFFIKQVAQVAREQATKSRREGHKGKGFFARKPRTAQSDHVMLL